MKRLFDIAVALLGLLLLSPLLILFAILIKLDSKGDVFFRHERMGKGFRPFSMLKLRSMVQDAPQKGGPVTFGNDPRITRLGRFLRKTKIDELPQLLNVLKGEMSLVGPRPEIRKYVELYREDYVEILKVRPGITDLASLTYQDEAAVLGQSDTPEETYREKILPEKIKLSKEYIKHSSFSFDFILILKTLPRLFGSNRNGALKGSLDGSN